MNPPSSLEVGFRGENTALALLPRNIKWPVPLTSLPWVNDPLWTRHDRAGAPGEPLTSRSYANNLKKYAVKAGMRRVNIHQTRHTYARIIFEDSGDLLETQSALDHESQVTTRVYVQTVAVKRDKHSGRIASRIRRRKVESPNQSG
jgi:integrase